MSANEFALFMFHVSSRVGRDFRCVIEKFRKKFKLWSLEEFELRFELENLEGNSGKNSEFSKNQWRTSKIVLEQLITHDLRLST